MTAQNFMIRDSPQDTEREVTEMAEEKRLRRPFGSSFPPKVALVSFTDRGGRLNRRLAQALEEQGYMCGGYEKRGGGCGEEPGLSKVEEPLTRWAGRRFSDSEYIIFIGAAGIAVRSIAPWIEDKWTDPGVVVIDEAGKYVIPILSGHRGGANEMAEKSAELLGAVPVITTATDINRRFAVDLFAVKNGLVIGDRVLAKEISGEILRGGKVGVFSDYPVQGSWPKELTPGQMQDKNFWITRQTGGKLPEGCQDGGGDVLRLIPRTIHIGVGCRRGASKRQIEEAVFQVLERWNCAPESAARIASIDLKKQEPGLLHLSQRLNAPFCTYGAETLAGVGGDFQDSEFVASVAGVGNVCERAALQSVSDTERGGTVICRKQVVNGVTVALAEETWKGYWDR